MYTIEWLDFFSSQIRLLSFASMECGNEISWKLFNNQIISISFKKWTMSLKYRAKQYRF